MNKSIMMGRVVNEPDLRYTQTENGELAIANFRLAVNRKFVRRGDPEADFFSCTAFGRKAEFAEKYLFKGIKILVCRMTTTRIGLVKMSTACGL